MSLNFKILGKPFRDNALYVTADNGNNFSRILFDIGEDVLNYVKYSEIKKIDMLFLSHLHIDHIAGFDFLFRRIYDRENKPLQIFGPQGTTEIIHHRLQGFKWNLHSELTGEFLVKEINEKKIISTKFLASEGFSKRHFLSEEECNDIVFDSFGFYVTAKELNHKTVSLGYSLKEKDSLNINKEVLEEKELPKGAWLEKLKDKTIPDTYRINLNKTDYTFGELRNLLIINNEGAKITYLTDFIFDKSSKKSAKFLSEKSDYLICESQYLQKDEELAKKNYHLTAKQSAEIAKTAGVKKLFLFHISDRYSNEQINLILDEARSIFPETYLPESWIKKIPD